MSSPSVREIKARLAGREILVAGIARDCARNLTGDVSRLGAALSSFGRVRWLVVESDSRDDTLGVLRGLAATVPDFRFLSLGALEPELPLQTERLARCRNTYLGKLRDPEYAGTDYVAVADLDGLNTLISPAAVLSCWSRDDWDVCTANQAGPYYDIFALRHPDWSPNDCWRQYAFLRGRGLTRPQAIQAAVRSRMIVIPEDGEWIEVDSAFGGFAIYKREALDDAAVYAGTTGSSSLVASARGREPAGRTGTGAAVCEHVTLHAHLRRNGRRIFINPRLINAAGTPWTAAPRPSWPARARAALLGWARRALRRDG